MAARRIRVSCFIKYGTIYGKDLFHSIWLPWDPGLISMALDDPATNDVIIFAKTALWPGQRLLLPRKTNPDGIFVCIQVS